MCLSASVARRYPWLAISAWLRVPVKQQVRLPRALTHAAPWLWLQARQWPGHTRHPAYLGHRSIASTVRYTALAPDWLKGFWKD
jgi:hypothetical protein